MTEILIISSLAIIVTLIYASYLDLKQRRVPFGTWIPAFVIAGVIVVIFYYITYGEEAGLNPVLFFLMPFFISAFFLALDWTYTIYIKKTGKSEIDRSVLIETYLSWFLLGIPASVLIFTAITGFFNIISVIAALSFIFCIFLEFISVIHLWGGADSTAMMIISAMVPVFPVIPLWGYPDFTFFFPMSVLLNAVILNLFVPAGLFVYNIIKKNKAPLKYLFIGYPVPGERITDHFGFIIEEFGETDGTIDRKFMKFSSSISRMVSGKKRMYTQDFKKNPEQYRDELDLYRRAGHVWISFGVPFIIPILAGFLFAFFIGDIFTLLVDLAGVIA